MHKVGLFSVHMHQDKEHDCGIINCLFEQLSFADRQTDKQPSL